MNMIEKVARAMCGPSFDAGSFITTSDGREPKDHRDYWLRKARTAIEALREPTDYMIQAVHDAEEKDGYTSVEDMRCETAWPIMIDAALSEPVTSPTSSDVSA